jgi:hypothetical protein
VVNLIGDIVALLFGFVALNCGSGAVKSNHGAEQGALV